MSTAPITRITSQEENGIAARSGPHPQRISSHCPAIAGSDSVACLAGFNSMDVLTALFKQPYRVIALVFGVALVAFPCITVDEDYRWTAHSPSTAVPVVVGVALLLLSCAEFVLTLLASRTADINNLAGLDLRRVKEKCLMDDRQWLRSSRGQWTHRGIRP
jgi:hypothetical protein